MAAAGAVHEGSGVSCGQGAHECEHSGQEAGREATTAHSYSDSPAEAILATAKKFKADLIVMASHGRKGLDKLLLGSETQRVLARTKLPVLVVR